MSWLFSPTTCAFCVRSDLLESKKLVLDDVFSCRAQGTVTLARKLITKIAEVHRAARAARATPPRRARTLA